MAGFCGQVRIGGFYFKSAGILRNFISELIDVNFQRQQSFAESEHAKGMHGDLISCLYNLFDADVQFIVSRDLCIPVPVIADLRW